MKLHLFHMDVNTGNRCNAGQSREEGRHRLLEFASKAQESILV